MSGHGGSFLTRRLRPRRRFLPTTLAELERRAESVASGEGQGGERHGENHQDGTHQDTHYQGRNHHVELDHGRPSAGSRGHDNHQPANHANVDEAAEAPATDSALSGATGSAHRATDGGAVLVSSTRFVPWRRGGPPTDEGRGERVQVPASAIAPMDLLSESVAGLFARPGRMILTVLGTVIGLAALVATIGLSRTAGNQIIARFDELSATEITVTSKAVPEDGPTSDLPWDAAARVQRLNGVVAAGTLSEIDVGKALVSASPITDPQRRTRFSLGVEAASPELYEAIRAHVRTGRLPDAGHVERGDRVAVLGAKAAEQLGITRLDHLPAISIGDEVFLVIGIVDEVQRKHALLSSVMITEGVARDLYQLSAPKSVVIETKIGAASLLSEQVPFAIRPDHPDGLKIATPDQPQQIRAGVRSDLQVLFIMLGGVSLLVGAIGIANVTLVSVMERVGEIGLRRALGATRRHIAAQFLLESGAMGFLGGILGASVGMLIVVAVAAYQTWTPVIDPSVPFLAPVIGGLTGLVAGAYPAIRAARLQPVEALRSGTS